MLIECSTLNQTVGLGRTLGRHLTQGDVLALHGDLGSGKTTFTSGLACGVGVPDEYIVTSPTFVLMHTYPGRLTMHHLDFYRMSSAQEFHSLGLDEHMGMKDVLVIEWFEKFPSVWSGDTIHVYLSMKSETTRTVRIQPTGVRSRQLIERLHGEDLTS